MLACPEVFRCSAANASFSWACNPCAPSHTADYRVGTKTNAVPTVEDRTDIRPQPYLRSVGGTCERLARARSAGSLPRRSTTIPPTTPSGRRGRGSASTHAAHGRCTGHPAHTRFAARREPLRRPASCFIAASNNSCRARQRAPGSDGAWARSARSAASGVHCIRSSTPRVCTPHSAGRRHRLPEGVSGFRACGAAHAVPTLCPQLQITSVNYREVFTQLDGAETL